MNWDTAAQAADDAAFLHVGYAALYRAQGEGAGEACRVMIDRGGLSESVLQQTLTSIGISLRLRKSEVAAPKSGDTIEATVGAGTESFTLRGDSVQGAGGRVWVCEAREGVS